MKKIFSFTLLCLSGHSHRVTLIFKNTKNNFLFFWCLSDRSRRVTPFFQIIQMSKI